MRKLCSIMAGSAILGISAFTAPLAHAAEATQTLFGTLADGTEVQLSLIHI